MRCNDQKMTLPDGYEPCWHYNTTRRSGWKVLLSSDHARSKPTGVLALDTNDVDYTTPDVSVQGDVAHRLRRIHASLFIFPILCCLGLLHGRHHGAKKKNELRGLILCLCGATAAPSLLFKVDTYISVMILYIWFVSKPKTLDVGSQKQ